jgi:hypothetical protein
MKIKQIYYQINHRSIPCCKSLFVILSFSASLCVVYPKIYDFWFPFWYLQTFFPIMTHIKHMWNIHYVEAYRTFVPYVKHTLCRSIQNVCTICEAYIMSKYTECLYHMWSIYYVEAYRTFVPYVKHTLCRSIHNVCTICEAYIMSKYTARLYHMWSIHYVEAYRTCVPYVKYTLCRDIQNVCTICEAYIMSKYAERLYHMWSIHYVEACRTFVPYVKYTLCRGIQNVCTICGVDFVWVFVLTLCCTGAVLWLDGLVNIII